MRVQQRAAQVVFVYAACCRAIHCRRIVTKPEVLIISPALKAANNGNWHTALRWAKFLADDFKVSIASEWDESRAPDLMIALHARRSAAPFAGFTARFPARPAVLVLTGTDLYRDIRVDAEARASL
ncbi:MAG: hypothetical protein JO347_00620, partial [Candidatus Eremiobacteraeota bacterium]|nr:hypothetical protein [Candidatus Eremiobacteraeota bacterium]